MPGRLVGGGNALSVLRTTARAFLAESVALVVAGIVIAWFVPQVRGLVTADVILVALVPGLVFDAAFDLKPAVLRTVAPALGWLAIPGVLITAAIVALAVSTQLPIALGFIVGAIVSATDPVAVVATLQRLRMPDRLRTVVEGESLLNDGTGLALVSVALIAALTDASAPSLAASFILIVVASAAAGVVAGIAGTFAVGRSRDGRVATVAAIAFAYSCYVAASLAHLSGILVTVIAAVVMGQRLRASESALLAERIDRAGAVVASILSALTFLAIGAAIPLDVLAAELGVIALAIVAVLVARALFVYVPYVFVRASTPVAWAHIVFASGLRGAIACAAALSLPDPLPQRDLVRTICFGVILVTLVVQGLVTPLLVRRLAPGA